MALALYRKYRPATFAEVVGQEHVTAPLMTAVDSGRINHAYLFSGPRGCGKTSSARILARSLNCEQGPTSTPCGTCQSCIDLAPDGPGNIDVIEIDAASHGGVDDARELRERAFQLPVANRYKIYIIDEAHMVSNQGFNALLKVVEEPPESVIFIFATTEPDKVLPTIRSRTHHYPFRLVPPAAMRELLDRNCQSEGVTVGSAVLPLVVRAGGGSVRDSQSLLDQLIAGAGPGGITYDDALALLGVTDAALLDDMVEAIGVSDGATVFGTVDRLVDAGHDPRRFAADLLDRLRDLILLAAVPEAGSKGLIDAPEDHLKRLADQAARLGLTTASRLADIVHVGLTEMRGTTAPRLGLELICARMLLPAVSSDGAALVQRMERLERRMEIGGVPSGGSSGGAAPSGSSAPRSGSAFDSSGMTPRQRAEARVAAERGEPTPSQRPPSQPAPSEPAPSQPAPGQPAAEVPSADATQRTPAAPAPQPAPAPEPSNVAPAGADSDSSSESSASEPPAPAPRAEESAQRPEQSERPAPAGSARRTPPANPPAPESVSPDDGGWPEVRAPGSGRGGATSPAATPPAATSPVAPAEAKEPVASAGGEPAPSPTGRAQATEPTPKASDSSEARPQTAEAPSAAAPQPSTAAPQQSVAAPTPASTEFDIAEVRRQWRAVVEHIKRTSRATAALAETATPVTVQNGSLVLAAPPALARRLSDPSQNRPLLTALSDVLGVSWSIKVTDNPGAAGAAATSGSSAPSPQPSSPSGDIDDYSVDPDDESVEDPRASLDPGEAAVSLLRDQLGAEEIDDPHF